MRNLRGRILNSLYTTELPRWKKFRAKQVRSTVWSVPFIDEHGKLTTARWKFKEGWYVNREPVYYMYRLDGRSIRYMRRVKIIDCCEL